MQLWVLVLQLNMADFRKRSKILHKNFISNIRIFQPFEIKKMYKKLISFVLFKNNLALYR